MGCLKPIRQPMGGLITLIAWLDWAPYELCFAAEKAHADGRDAGNLISGCRNGEKPSSAGY